MAIKTNYNEPQYIEKGFPTRVWIQATRLYIMTIHENCIIITDTDEDILRKYDLYIEESHAYPMERLAYIREYDKACAFLFNLSATL
jgi:hypothetical protein